MKKLTVVELSSYVHSSLHAAVNRWLERGDGAAVYINAAGDSPNYGHVKTVSYGSSSAQLEGNKPPTRLPDIGAQINWAYTLVGVYRGKPIPVELTEVAAAAEAAAEKEAKK